MAQIASNPWQFTNADQATTVAITSITNNVNSILVTTTSAHGYANNYTAVSIQGTTYNGPYRILAIPSTTTLLLQNRDQYRTLANAGAVGNLLSMAYMFDIRSEQVYWQPNVATDTLLLTDGFGNTLWAPKVSQSATGGGFGPYSYGKLFWTQSGLVINTLPASNTVQMTIN